MTLGRRLAAKGVGTALLLGWLVPTLPKTAERAVALIGARA